eukprot:TRINITY_DN1870_c0_g1_i1.p1 TRINITY_DN1870_c0_g1~~TRINITY_DN1870_c0_g1_i1.p1  ORF type:complete len:163 (+),score=24.00 TRINITY_DN1870_c0_g1_i1:74-562(+)
MNANEVGARTPLTVIRSLFQKYDENHNNSLSLAELRHVVYDCGYYLEDHELKAFANDIDANDSEGISFEEFYKAVTSPQWQKCLTFMSTENGARAVEWFQQYDNNRNGSLNLSEWRRLWSDLQLYYPTWEETKQTAEESFRKVNSEGDSIKFNEFMTFMKYV